MVVFREYITCYEEHFGTACKEVQGWPKNREAEERNASIPNGNSIHLHICKEKIISYFELLCAAAKETLREKLGCGTTLQVLVPHLNSRILGCCWKVFCCFSPSLQIRALDPQPILDECAHPQVLEQCFFPSHPGRARRKILHIGFRSRHHHPNP